MSENMEIDCRVGEPLPEDVDAVSYDVGIPEEFLVQDENDKIVMVANPETFSRFMSHPKVVAACAKWRREPRNVFKVAKEITVVDEPISRDRLKALWDRFAHVPDKEDYEAIYWVEQHVRDMVARNMQHELDTFRRRAVA